MIPKWAFGLWMSRCSYQTQEEVEAVARRLREEQLPADVIHIDGWQKMSEAGVWQWDLERFPDPRGMIKTPFRAAFPSEPVDVALYCSGHRGV